MLAAAEREHANEHAVGGRRVVAGDDPRRHRAGLVDERCERFADLVVDQLRTAPTSVVEIIVAGCG
jgi:hypothetical protein